MAALEAGPGVYDPVARAALAQMVGLAQREGPDEGLRRLRRDGEPAVRFFAAVTLLLRAEPHEWPELDAAIRADLPASAPTLHGVGGLLPAGRWWSVAFTRRGDEPGREVDCYAQAGELIAAGPSVAVRQVGVDLAVEAMRTWRAGPARLAPVLVAALDKQAVRTAVTKALCGSVTATGLAADPLVGLLSDPSLAPAVAVALGSAGDRRAMPRLEQLLLAGRWQPCLGDAVRAVAPVLPDPTPLVRVARQVLTRYRCPSDDDSADAGHLVRAVLWGLTALGPAAAAAVPELIDRLRAAADRGDSVCCELDALGAIGSAAEPAVPLLRHFAAPRTNLAGRACWALVRITGDRSVVDDLLDAYPERPRPLVADRLDELLTWLVDHGGLTDRQGTQVRHLFSQPRFGRLEAATALWKHAGPTVAADFLATLPDYLDDDLYGPMAMNCLVAMGPAAQPALPHLDRLIAHRRRVAVHLGDPDDQMRADENLLAAAITTRRQIASSVEGSNAPAPTAGS